MIHIPRELFASFFRDHIRVLLDWERIMHDDAAIGLKVDTTPRNWFAPWYIDSVGREADFRAPDAIPIAFDTLPDLIPSLSQERQDRILDFSRAFRQQREPVQIVVATYALGSGKYLVLDGNHRLGGVVHAGVASRILNFSIAGPLDPQILPDLLFWREASGNRVTRR